MEEVAGEMADPGSVATILTSLTDNEDNDDIALLEQVWKEWRLLSLVRGRVRAAGEPA